MLRFSFQNGKLKALAKSLGLMHKQVISFDLPAGWTCPAAVECKAWTSPKTGKLKDGPHQQFRCYAANTECYAPDARRLRWANLNQILPVVNDPWTVARMILDGIEATHPRVQIVRVHSSGDFFKPAYFDAWRIAATLKPGVDFYGYTKVLPYVGQTKTQNFRLIYSWGGKYDGSWTPEVPVCHVVHDPAETSLPIICQDGKVEDFDYIMSGKSFALTIHGTQPKRVKPL